MQKTFLPVRYHQRAYGSITVNVMDNAGCAFYLSQRERAGVRAPTGLAKPLTLTLSQRERGKKGPSKPA
jgi:hypothetical protein